MNVDPYSARVRRLFAEAAHAGPVEHGVVASVEDQGIAIELSARPAGDELGALGFRARGCPHVIAAAEAFCAAYEGRPIAALDDFSAAEIMRTLPVPVEKSGRILVLEDTVRALGTALRDAQATTD